MAALRVCHEDDIEDLVLETSTTIRRSVKKAEDDIRRGHEGHSGFLGPIRDLGMGFFLQDSSAAQSNDARMVGLKTGIVRRSLLLAPWSMRCPGEDVVPTARSR